MYREKLEQRNYRVWELEHEVKLLRKNEEFRINEIKKKFDGDREDLLLKIEELKKHFENEISVKDAITNKQQIKI